MKIIFKVIYQLIFIRVPIVFMWEVRLIEINFFQGLLGWLMVSFIQYENKVVDYLVKK